MSDTNKNEAKDVFNTELSIKEGDIVWKAGYDCICEVLSVQPQFKSRPVIYITRIAGNCCYNNESAQDEVELLLPKEQIWYESVVSDYAVKTFYKGKLILDLQFEFKNAIPILSQALYNIKRTYIFNQLLEMYPNTKISEVIVKSWY